MGAAKTYSDNRNVHTIENIASTKMYCLVRFTRGIIGHYFFRNEEGAAVTVNGQRYQAMLTDFYFKKLISLTSTTFGSNKTAQLHYSHHHQFIAKSIW